MSTENFKQSPGKRPITFCRGLTHWLSKAEFESVKSSGMFGEFYPDQPEHWGDLPDPTSNPTPTPLASTAMEAADEICEINNICLAYRVADSIETDHHRNQNQRHRCAQRNDQAMKTKKDLQFYLAADRFALGRHGSPKIFGDEIWKFQIALRKCEYYKTKSTPFRPLYLFWKIRKRQLGLTLGFEIPEFVFGAGLRINHYGSLIVSRDSYIGRWCDIHQGVNIGSSNPAQRIPTERYSPTIGDNAWIGPGAKIFGNITVGQRVQIGANAVVGKSFGDDLTLGGVPAKIIRQSGTAAVDVAANPNRAEEFFKLHPEFQSYQNQKSS